MRTRDLLLYCTIGVVVASTAIVIGVYRARVGLPLGLPSKWLGFAIMTAFVFGNAISYAKRLWGWPRFWGLLGLFLILHLGLGLLVVLKLTNIGLIHFAVATPIEIYF